MASVRKGSLPPQIDASIKPHTLLLGTQPSDNSLKRSIYFATKGNAFWHVVGDALGFRRGFDVEGQPDAPNFISPHLLHEEVVTYDEALRRLHSRGYILWDLIESSVRKGSLDKEIKEPVYNDVGGLVAKHPSIRRIVFSTGKKSAGMFRTAFKDEEWLRAPGAFHAADDDASREVFGKFFSKLGGGDEPPAAGVESIKLVVPQSVSPASVPREAQCIEAQANLGYGPAPGQIQDTFSRRPAHIYPVKRADWFEKVFFNEPAVKATPRLGEVESHFQPPKAAPAKKTARKASGGGGKATTTKKARKASGGGGTPSTKKSKYFKE